ARAKPCRLVRGMVGGGAEVAWKCRPGLVGCTTVPVRPWDGRFRPGGGTELLLQASSRATPCGLAPGPVRLRGESAWKCRLRRGRCTTVPVCPRDDRFRH